MLEGTGSLSEAGGRGVLIKKKRGNDLCVICWGGVTKLKGGHQTFSHCQGGGDNGEG